MNKFIETIITQAVPNWYTKIYCNICYNASVRATVDGYTEKHHILPQSFKMGGNKDKENIVCLTAKEHYICHRLLTKMFENHFKFKMIRALFMMSTTRKDKRYLPNSRVYENLRIQNSIEISKHNKEIGLIPPSALGRIVSAETKKKLSDLHKGNTHWLGKTHSEESKRKIRDTKKNNPWIAPKEKGITHSEFMKGRNPWNKGKKTGQRVWNKGKPWSDEIKQKIAKQRSGFKWVYNSNNIEQLIRLETLPEFLSNGWKIGRVFRRRKK